MKTEYILIENSDSDKQKILKAARLLEDGGLVVFPTETVYGIGCVVEKDSISRLDNVKGRNPDKRYTLHVGDKGRIADYIPDMDPRTRLLVDKSLPGPVTLVFKLTDSQLKQQETKLGMEIAGFLYRDNTIGVRCPDNAVASELLSLSVKPVVAPSANISGDNPAVTAKEAFENLDGKVDMVLDSDSWAGCIYNKSSTVVKIDGRNIDVLREGVISVDEIAEKATVNILFVCTGNTCRSPMAEYFCRKYISEKLKSKVDSIEHFGYKVSSAGTMTYGGCNASPEVIDICSSKGIDASGHCSSALSQEIISKADYVFAMTKSHLMQMEQMFPLYKGKYDLLDNTGDIPDPIGGSMDVYRSCAERIEKAIKERISEIWHENRGCK